MKSSVLIVVFLFLPAALASLPRTSAANVSFTLKADGAGWNASQPGGANPVLTVNVGDSVTITIDWVNGFAHNWALYPPGTTSSGVSVGGAAALRRTADVSSSIRVASITFTINQAGTYEYFCEYHAFSMHGQFVVLGTNAFPTVTVNAPTSGVSWSGGSNHDVSFDVTDDEPASNLTAWTNYSYNAGAAGGPIAGPLTPGANPNLVSWTLPPIDATDVLVAVTVVDARGGGTTRSSLPFETDSTAPTPTGTPGAGSTGVSRLTAVVISWSEPMNRAATESASAFGLTDVSGGAWVAGSMAWSLDSRQMTFTPNTALEPLTVYGVHVNTTAFDDSDPGNAPGAPVTWTFVTGSVLDPAPPTVSAVDAAPSPQAPGDFVNITATITDNVGVTAVQVHVVGPSFNETLPMAQLDANTWHLNRTYATAGTYTFTVLASDAAGNIGSRGGTFTMTQAVDLIGTDWTPYIALAILVTGGITATVFLARRRARRPPKA